MSNCRQHVLQAVAGTLSRFQSDEATGTFRGSLWTISPNKLNDHFRKQASDRLQPMPQDELRELVEASEQNAPLTAADRHDLEYALNLLDSSKPECRDYLWNHYVIGFDYGEIAEEQNLNYDNVRMKIGRCLEEAKSLVA